MRPMSISRLRDPPTFPPPNYMKRWHKGDMGYMVSQRPDEGHLDSGAAAPARIVPATQMADVSGKKLAVSSRRSSGWTTISPSSGAAAAPSAGGEDTITDASASGLSRRPWPGCHCPKICKPNADRTGLAGGFGRAVLGQAVSEVTATTEPDDESRK